MKNGEKTMSFGVNTVNRFKFITDDEVEQMHGATLCVLEKTGVKFDDETACKLFSDAGARVDGNTVRIPRELITALIEQCPGKFTLFARDKAFDVEIGAGKIFYTNGFGSTKVEDLDTGEYRPSTVKDLRDFSRLADVLENVHYCMMQVHPQEIRQERADVVRTAVLLSNVRKNAHLSLEHSENLDYCFEVAEIASDNVPKERRPIFTSGATPTTPLSYDRSSCGRLIKCAKAGIPTLVVSGAMGGGTAPVTLAGALTVQNAEVLAGLALVQLVSPGLPSIYGSFSSVMDMRLAKFQWGSPELTLMQAATARLCERCGVPFAYGTAGVADSPVCDFFAGVDKTASLLAAAFAGVEVLHDGCSGLLDSTMVSSYGQLVLDNELCNYVNRFLKGIEVNEETIALDVIDRVGCGGNFLTEMHTAEHFKEELYIPGPIRSYTKRTNGMDGLLELNVKARRMARELIDANNDEVISPEQEKTINDLLERIQRL